MLKVKGVSKKFKNGKTIEPVLNGINLEIIKGETVSIIGKSGSGKSTLARIICGSIVFDSGEIFYKDQLLYAPYQKFNKKFRKDIQMIQQQPFLSLDPRQKIGMAIMEPMLEHKLIKNKQEAMQQVKSLLESVWLHQSIINRLPSQISGGQAQRVVIARALALNPQIIIADESTSMLDISAQAQVIHIFNNLKKKKGISILFISHDKPLVNVFSDRIYKINNGKIE